MKKGVAMLLIGMTCQFQIHAGFDYSLLTMLRNGQVGKTVTKKIKKLDRKSVNAVDNLGNALLHILTDTSLTLSSGNRIRLAGLLIKQGADVNVMNAKGETPLHLIAAGGQDIKFATFLFENEADANARTIHKSTPLQMAAVSGPDNTNFVDLLIRHGADINAQNAAGETAFFVAKARGTRLNISAFFAEMNADRTLKTTKGMSVVFLDKLNDYHEALTEQSLPQPLIQQVLAIMIKNPQEYQV